MTATEGTKRGERWAGRVAFAWAVLVTSADLKYTIYLHIHWIISAIAVLLMLPYLLRTRWETVFPARLPVLLLLLAVCVPIVYGAPAIYSLTEATKLLMILLGGLIVFVGHPRLTQFAFQGFVLAAYLNSVLLVGGFMGLNSASIMAGLHRWGTPLNYPGSLSRVGISVWVFAAYLLIKRRSLAYLTLLAASIVVVYMDGSRTAMLLMFLGVICVSVMLAMEASRLRRAVVISSVGISFLLALFAYTGIFSGEARDRSEGSIGRIQELTGSLQTAGVAGLETADAVRFQMLQDVMEAIRAHPLHGTGIETTTTETISGPMPIHMTYLQVWADMGPLGLVAYTALVWGWIGWAPRVIRRIQRFEDPKTRALYYNALFLLLVNGIGAFFHPISTEWSEWIMFLIPYAMAWELARRPATHSDFRGIQRYA